MPVGKRATYEELRLKNEARSLGHIARIFRSSRCQLIYDNRHPRVFYDGRRFPDYDVIIPRVRLLSEVELRAAVVKQLQLMGIPMFNHYIPIVHAKNKLRTMQILDHYGLAVLRTLVVDGPSYVNDAVKKVGGMPVILKATTGSYGKGVVIVESKRGLHSALDALNTRGSGSLIMIQEYVKEAKGVDTRVFVVSGKIIGGMRRKAKRGEFRSNLELGGGATVVDLTQEEKDVALAATKALDLQVAGVDLIATKSGPVVMEVNANPGFEGLEQTAGINVARAIVKASLIFAKRKKARTAINGKDA